MAYVVCCLSRRDARRALGAIERRLARSRFVIEGATRIDSPSPSERRRSPYRHRLILSHWGHPRIRLRQKKDYCGQHPGPCQALFPRKHQVNHLLEGKDWAAFNDLVNDALDALSLDANITTQNREATRNPYWVRRGLARRVSYDMDYFERYGRPIVLWSPDAPTDFENWCGRQAPPSEVPKGTPGLAVWRLRDEAVALAQL